MKAPAYAKPLIDARRAGRHPERVVVIYGHDWYVAEGITRLAVKPDEALGLSWAAVAGLPVQVLDRAGADAPEGEIYLLLGEIARFAATLHVSLDGFTEAAVGDLAFAARKWDADTRAMRWPAWWSDELEKIHGQNTQRWITEIASCLAA